MAARAGIKEWLNASVSYCLWLLLVAKDFCSNSAQRLRGCCRDRASGGVSENVALVRTLFRQNRLATLVYFCLYASLGACVGFVGPVLLDLTCLFSATMSSVSWAFFAQAFSMVVGSILVGVLSKRIAADFLMLMAALLLPLAMLVLAVSRGLQLAVVAMSLIGLSNGIIDCLANFQMVYLYEKAVSPFLHAMYFSYGIGAVVSPLIAQPFLLNEDCTPYVENGTAIPTSWLMHGKVRHAFWLMAGLQVPVAILMFVHVAYGGFRIRAVSCSFQRLINAESIVSLSKAKGSYEDQRDLDDKHILQKYIAAVRGLAGAKVWRNAVVTACVVIMVFLYDGMQGNYSQYVSLYAMREAKDFNRSDGAYVNVAFWGSFTVGRLVAVVLAIRFTPYSMVFASVTGTTFALALLVSMPAMKSTLVFGTCLFGLFCSSVTPAAISMAEQFVDMTRLHMTLVVVAASAGEMLVPVIQGQIFENNTRSFLVMAVTIAAISWFVYVLFWIVGKGTDKFQCVTHSSFVFLHIVPLQDEKVYGADLHARFSLQEASLGLRPHDLEQDSSLDLRPQDLEPDVSQDILRQDREPSLALPPQNLTAFSVQCDKMSPNADAAT